MFQEAKWPRGLISYLHHEASVRSTPANRQRIIIRSDDKADRKPGARRYVWSLEAIINYQRITRRIEITRTYDGGYEEPRQWYRRPRFISRRSSLCRAVNPSATRYSRSVLINRLFMFNAAWYSDPKVFEALRRKARLRRESAGGEHGNFEQGNAFASRQRLKPVEKSQE